MRLTNVVKFLGSVAFAAALVMPSESDGRGGPETGNDLFAACNAEMDTPKFTFCVGYIIGYVEGQSWAIVVARRRLSELEITAETNEFGTELVGYCVPQEVINQQIIDIVVRLR